MKKILKSNIPQNSIITTNFGKIDYCDSYQITKATNETIEQITENLFKLPKWAVWLMNLRNSLMKPFGLQVDESNKNELGGYFTIIEKSENEIVMEQNDKHLNFRTSVFIDKEFSHIYLTTIVRYNNFGGKLYFFPVKPFHKMIIKSSLKRELKR